MRLPLTEDHAGPMLELHQIQRQLHLGPPVDEGTATIEVAHIIGSAGRARDFDGQFNPVSPALRKRIDEIRAASPPAMDEPIEVVRIDRAYFVADGHKRVSIAKRDGREFIDAHVSHLPSRYALTPEVEVEAIERTAREGEFRRHSGVAEAVPEARFALTDVSNYGELLVAVQSYAFDRVLALGRPLTAAEAARLWYDDKYLPALARGREVAGDLLDSVTEADLFLMMHRQERSEWGGECGDPDCLADMLLAMHRKAAAAERSPLDRVLNRDPRPRNTPALLLPMASELDDT